MPVLRKYKCPDCGGIFEHLHSRMDEGPPEECELCHSNMGEEMQQELPLFSIKTHRSSAVDQSVRALENSTGITNLRDNLRNGDTAAYEVNNPVTQFAQAMGHNYFGGGGSGMPSVDAVKGKAGAVTQGLAAIQNKHARG